MRSSLAILALLSCSVAPLAARADILNFTLTTTIDGALKPDATNGAGPEIDFSNEALTITGSYDTTQVTSDGNFSSVGSALTYTIGNLGAFPSAFDIYGGIDGMSLSNSGQVLTVGSERFGTLEFINSPLLATLDLTHAFSVTASTASFPGAVDIVHSPAGGLYDFYVLANDGPLTFTLGNPSGTTSPAVPEPSSLVMLSTGALGLLGAARRRFVRA
jgi:hypothetical protein